MVAEIRIVMDGRALFRIITQAVTGRDFPKYIAYGPGCFIPLSALTQT